MGYIMQEDAWNTYIIRAEAEAEADLDVYYDDDDAPKPRCQIDRGHWQWDF